MKNKIGYLFIVVGIIIFVFYYIYIYLNVTKELNIINNGSVNYLEIPKYNLKKIIKYNESDLENNYVFVYSSLEDNNIILAGHNNRLVFNKIHNLDINDELILNIKENKKTYKVIKNIVVKNNDFSYLENTNEHLLTLITCVGNDNYRRIVVAKAQ